MSGNIVWPVHDAVMIRKPRKPAHFAKLDLSRYQGALVLVMRFSHPSDGTHTVSVTSRRLSGVDIASVDLVVRVANGTARIQVPIPEHIVEPVDLVFAHREAAPHTERVIP